MKKQPPTLRAVAYSVAAQLEQQAARLRESTDPLPVIDTVLAVALAGQRALNGAWLEGRR